MDGEVLYRVNAGFGLMLTIGLSAIFVLMVVLWPSTRLRRMALWFMFWCCAVMWRWIGAVLKPDWFSIRDSLVPTVIFAGAAMATAQFAIVAWYEHVQDARRQRRSRPTP